MDPFWWWVLYARSADVDGWRIGEVVHRCAMLEPYIFRGYMGVSKNRGKTPKMDGENNGTPEKPIKMDDLGGNPTIFGSIQIDNM